MPAGEGESAVKVTLDSAEFLGELRKMAQGLKQAGDDGKRKFQGLSKGIDAAKGKMREMAGTAKTALKAVATLGGAVSFGAGIKGAVALDAKMRALAFRVEVATQKGTDHMAMQRDLERVAAKTSRTTEEMATAFDTVFSATKDLEFTRGVLASIGTTATATNSEIDMVATIAQQMSRKFKLSADQVDDAFAQIFEGAQQGGPTFSQFSETIDLLGSGLIEAGFKGKRAMDFLIGSLNETDAEFGNLRKQVTGIQTLLLNLTQGAKLKTMAKELKIPASQLLDEKDFFGVLKRVLGEGQKGLDTLRAQIVGPEERKALRILFTDPFEKALDRAKASGLKGKDAIDQALTMLEGRIDEFGKGALTAARLQEQAAKERQAPDAQMRQALESLTKAFAQPEIIEGVNELAKMLPGVAKVLGNFLGFAAKHPILAGTLGVGLNVGTAFLSAMAREAVTNGVVKQVVTGHITGGAAAASRVMNAHIAGGVKLKGALMGGGLVAAAAIAAAFAKEKIDEDAARDAATTGGLSVARAKAAGRGGTIQQQEQRAANLQRSIAEREESSGRFTTVLGKGLAGTISGENLFAKEAKELAEAKQELIALRERIAEQKAAASGPQETALAPAAAKGPAGPSKVALDQAAPRLIAAATADAMGARVLNVRLVNAPGGVGATARSFGGRGPMSLPAPSQGGGI